MLLFYKQQGNSCHDFNDEDFVQTPLQVKACRCRCSETPTGVGKKVILKMPNIKEIGTYL